MESSRDWCTQTVKNSLHIIELHGIILTEIQCLQNKYLQTILQISLLFSPLLHFAQIIFDIY